MLNCNYCDKKGLLIYPVRYAVASPYGAAGVPGLSGNFRIENGPQQIGEARYALRALRAGYLYTYDERRGRFKAYVVTPTGHIWNFPLHYRAPHPSHIPFSCVEPGEIVRAYCLDIAHTPQDPATGIWIGWSNTEWTKALQKRVGDLGWRRKHMQCIDVEAMLAGSAAHTGEFGASVNMLAHFAADHSAMDKAFSFSNTPPTEEKKRHAWAGKMRDVMAAQIPHHKGFVVAVNDPVGITNDLSELTIPGLDAGFDEKLYQSKIVADILAMTEQRVRQEASDDIDFRDKVAEISENNPDGDTYNSIKTMLAMIKAGGPGRYVRKQGERRKKYGDAKAARQQAAADEAWHELTHDNDKPMLDMQRLKAFPATYEAAQKAFEPRFLKLLTAHVSWLRSEQLANWMEAVHDVNDIRSGYAYSESLAQCIGKAVSSAPCIDQLTLWLSSDKLSDTRNLYSRALLLNQSDLIAATEAQLKGSDIQYENILNIYKGAIARLDDPAQAAQLIDRFALTTANVINKGFSESAQSVARAMATVHLYLLAGGRIKASKMSAADVARWAIAQAQEQGIKLDTHPRTTKSNAYREARSAVNRHRPDKYLFAYELDIARLESEGHIAPGSIKGIGVPGIAQAQKWLGSSVPREFKLGAVTALVQILALTFAMKDLANNDQFNEDETRVKAITAMVSLGATIVETVAVSVEKSVEHPLGAFIRRQWAYPQKIAGKIVLAARAMGMFAGMFAAGYDIFVNAWNALERKEKILGLLYLANGLCSTGIALAAFLSAGALFWPLLFVSFLLGISIAFVNNSGLKNWIAHCEFSIGEKYKSFEEQMRIYGQVVGA